MSKPHWGDNYRGRGGYGYGSSSSTRDSYACSEGSGSHRDAGYGQSDRNAISGSSGSYRRDDYDRDNEYDYRASSSYRPTDDGRGGRYRAAAPTGDRGRADSYRSNETSQAGPSSRRSQPAGQRNGYAHRGSSSGGHGGQAKAHPIQSTSENSRGQGSAKGNGNSNGDGKVAGNMRHQRDHDQGPAHIRPQSTRGGRRGGLSGLPPVRPGAHAANQQRRKDALSGLPPTLVAVPTPSSSSTSKSTSKPFPPRSAFGSSSHPRASGSSSSSSRTASGTTIPPPIPSTTLDIDWDAVPAQPIEFNRYAPGQGMRFSFHPSCGYTLPPDIEFAKDLAERAEKKKREEEREEKRRREEEEREERERAEREQLEMQGQEEEWDDDDDDDDPDEEGEKEEAEATGQRRGRMRKDADSSDEEEIELIEEPYRPARDVRAIEGVMNRANGSDSTTHQDSTTDAQRARMTGTAATDQHTESETDKDKKKEKEKKQAASLPTSQSAPTPISALHPAPSPAQLPTSASTSTSACASIPTSTSIPSIRRRSNSTSPPPLNPWKKFKANDPAKFRESMLKAGGSLLSAERAAELEAQRKAAEAAAAAEKERLDRLQEAEAAKFEARKEKRRKRQERDKAQLEKEAGERWRAINEREARRAEERQREIAAAAAATTAASGSGAGSGSGSATGVGAAVGLSPAHQQGERPESGKKRRKKGKKRESGAGEGSGVATGSGIGVAPNMSTIATKRTRHDPMEDCERDERLKATSLLKQSGKNEPWVPLGASSSVPALPSLQQAQGSTNTSRKGQLQLSESAPASLSAASQVSAPTLAPAQESVLAGHAGMTKAPSPTLSNTAPAQTSSMIAEQVAQTQTDRASSPDYGTPETPPDVRAALPGNGIDLAPAPAPTSASAPAPVRSPQPALPVRITAPHIISPKVKLEPRDDSNPKYAHALDEPPDIKPTAAQLARLAYESGYITSSSPSTSAAAAAAHEAEGADERIEGTLWFRRSSMPLAQLSRLYSSNGDTMTRSRQAFMSDKSKKLQEQGRKSTSWKWRADGAACDWVVVGSAADPDVVREGRRRRRAEQGKGEEKQSQSQSQSKGQSQTGKEERASVASTGDKSNPGTASGKLRAHKGESSTARVESLEETEIQRDVKPTQAQLARADRERQMAKAAAAPSVKATTATRDRHPASPPRQRAADDEDELDDSDNEDRKTRRVERGVTDSDKHRQGGSEGMTSIQGSQKVHDASSANIPSSTGAASAGSASPKINVKRETIDSHASAAASSVPPPRTSAPPPRCPAERATSTSRSVLPSAGTAAASAFAVRTASPLLHNETSTSTSTSPASSSLDRARSTSSSTSATATATAIAHASANMTMDQLKAQMEAADRDLNMHYELEEAGAAPMPAIERRLEAKSRAAREAYFAALASARERERDSQRAKMEQARD